MDHESKVYKVDYLVQGSLSSSLVLPNTRSPLNPTLRVLSYNSLAPWGRAGRKAAVC